MSIPAVGIYYSICLLSCVCLSGCGRMHTNEKPVIQFTRVPPGSEGGPDKLDTVEGKVHGAKAGQRIVIYAKAQGIWWVQPLGKKPFTAIANDSSWKTPTHLGTQYAAILVDPGYQPIATIAALPAEGGAIAAVASVSVGAPFAAVNQKLTFSGYEWSIRRIASDRNGAVSYYDPANAWTDSAGRLHLKIARQGDHWTCSQVTSSSHLGYGTYLFSVGDTSRFEPAITLTMMTHDDLSAEHHREMEIELSRWGNPNSKGGDYVIQPYSLPENKVIFESAAGKMTHSLRWEPGMATFQTVRDSSEARGQVVARNVFNSGIPTPGAASVVVDFCDFKYSKVPLQNGAEVVIEKFQFLP